MVPVLNGVLSDSHFIFLFRSIEFVSQSTPDSCDFGVALTSTESCETRGFEGSIIGSGLAESHESILLGTSPINIQHVGRSVRWSSWEELG